MDWKGSNLQCTCRLMVANGYTLIVWLNISDLYVFGSRHFWWPGEWKIDVHYNVAHILSAGTPTWSLKCEQRSISAWKDFSFIHCFSVYTVACNSSLGDHAYMYMYHWVDLHAVISSLCLLFYRWFSIAKCSPRNCQKHLFFTLSKVKCRQLPPKNAGNKNLQVGYI